MGQIAQRENISTEKAAERLRDNGRLGQLLEGMRARKTVDRLLELATFQEASQAKDSEGDGDENEDRTDNKDEA